VLRRRSLTRCSTPDQSGSRGFLNGAGEPRKTERARARETSPSPEARDPSPSRGPVPVPKVQCAREARSAARGVPKSPALSLGVCRRKTPIPLRRESEASWPPPLFSRKIDSGSGSHRSLARDPPGHPVHVLPIFFRQFNRAIQGFKTPIRARLDSLLSRTESGFRMVFPGGSGPVRT